MLLNLRPVNHKRLPNIPGITNVVLEKLQKEQINHLRHPQSVMDELMAEALSDALYGAYPIRRPPVQQQLRSFLAKRKYLNKINRRQSLPVSVNEITFGLLKGEQKNNPVDAYESQQSTYIIQNNINSSEVQSEGNPFEESPLQKPL